MAFNNNPIDGEIHISPNGEKRKWNALTKVWEKFEEKIIPDATGTNDIPISKVWSGTYAEYQSIAVKQDDTVYFIKD